MGGYGGAQVNKDILSSESISTLSQQGFMVWILLQSKQQLLFFLKLTPPSSLLHDHHYYFYLSLPCSRSRARTAPLRQRPVPCVGESAPDLVGVHVVVSRQVAIGQDRNVDSMVVNGDG